MIIFEKKILLLVCILIILSIGGGIYYTHYNINKMYVPDKEDFFISEQDKSEAKYDEEHGIINVLLIGVDSRNRYEDARTDSIILATLDLNNKKIKLTSFMRDMYVPIPNHESNRINAAFFLEDLPFL